MPKPSFTPRLRSSHQRPAPAIPAAPVPLDQAPSAVFDADRVGRLVVNCRKVSSPRPDVRDAREIPNSRRYNEVEKAIVYLESACDYSGDSLIYDDTEPATESAKGNSSSVLDLTVRYERPETFRKECREDVEECDDAFRGR